MMKRDIWLDRRELIIETLVVSCFAKPHPKKVGTNFLRTNNLPRYSSKTDDPLGDALPGRNLRPELSRDKPDRDAWKLKATEVGLRGRITPLLGISYTM